MREYPPRILTNSNRLDAAYESIVLAMLRHWMKMPLLSALEQYYWRGTLRKKTRILLSGCRVLLCGKAGSAGNVVKRLKELGMGLRLRSLYEFKVRSSKTNAYRGGSKLGVNIRRSWGVGPPWVRHPRGGQVSSGQAFSGQAYSSQEYLGHASSERSGILWSRVLGSGLFKSDILRSDILGSNILGSGVLGLGILGSGVLRSGILGSGHPRVRRSQVRHPQVRRPWVRHHRVRLPRVRHHRGQASSGQASSGQAFLRSRPSLG
ncbi:hypothetical protein KY285_013303 [Solanum tuberosum]|nr:hypothetical protein KY285_013303 [Solanum tuberosum]